MRSLVGDPSRVPDGLYRRFVRRAQIDGLMADHLYAGEPYLALNAIVLGPAEHDRLRCLTRVFTSAFDRAGRHLAKDVAVLQEMGLPWVAAELLLAERPRVPLVGRFDFVRDLDGRWWLLEFNADTPSGIREAIVVDRLVHDLLPEAANLGRPNEGLANAVIACFLDALRDLPPGHALGLITDAGELEDLCQMAYTRDLLQGSLAERGISTVLGDVNNLGATRRGLTICRQPVSALYRYFPYESMLGTPAFSAIYDALAANKVHLLNGLYGLLLQHKGVIAWLWEHRDDPIFSDEEREAIRNHLPPTWPITSFEMSAFDEPFVVKQVFGREGEEIFLSEDLTPAVWARLRQERTYVVQRRVPVEEVDAVVQTSEGGKVTRGHAAVGAFSVGGAWAGYYTRFGARIITARAKWLATFVEGG